MQFHYRIVLVALLGASLGGSLKAQGKPAGSITAAAESAPDSSLLCKEFVYKESGGTQQKIEVYFPPQWATGEKFPAVIFFHGGSWAHGNLGQFRQVCRYFARRGLVAATASYQLAAKTGDASRKRVCLVDAKSAIRWMKAHSIELAIDPARLVGGGGSAGGHLAVLATLNSNLNDPSDPRDVDAHVAALLLFNPAFDPQDSIDAEVDVSSQLRLGLPPAIFFYGTKDHWKAGYDTNKEQIESASGNRHELWLAEGMAHGFFNTQPWTDLTLAKADSFLVNLGFLKSSSPQPPLKSGVSLVRAP